MVMVTVYSLSVAHVLMVTVRGISITNWFKTQYRKPIFLDGLYCLEVNRGEFVFYYY